MNLAGFGIPMKDKVPMYSAFLFFLVILLLFYIDFPPVFKNWVGDVHRLSWQFKTGIIGLIVFTFIAIWVYRHRAFYRGNRLDILRLIALFFAFFFIPITSFIILGITSHGFKVNPLTSLENKELHDQLHDVQFYIFMGAAVLFVIRFVKYGGFNSNVPEEEKSIGQKI